MKDQPVKVIVDHVLYEFSILIPSADFASDNEWVIELPASVIADYKAERDVAITALRAAEAKFQAYIVDNNLY